MARGFGRGRRRMRATLQVVAREISHPVADAETVSTGTQRQQQPTLPAKTLAQWIRDRNSLTAESETEDAANVAVLV